MRAMLCTGRFAIAQCALPRRSCEEDGIAIPDSYNRPPLHCDSGNGNCNGAAAMRTPISGHLQPMSLASLGVIASGSSKSVDEKGVRAAPIFENFSNSLQSLADCRSLVGVPSASYRGRKAPIAATGKASLGMGSLLPAARVKRLAQC